MKLACLGLLLALSLLTAAGAAPKHAPKLKSPAADAGVTLTAWVKLSTLNGPQVYVSRAGLALSKTDKDSKFAFVVTPAGGAAPIVVTSDFTPTPGLWYSIAGVYDKTAKEARLYVGGVLLKSAPAAAPSPGLAPAAVTAGSAVIEAVHVTLRALPEAQIAREVAAGRTAREPGMVTWANPVYFQGNSTGDDIHDPQIITVDDIYYLVATLASFRNYTDRDPKLLDLGSSPGISLYASRDLKVWKFQRWLLKSSDLPDTSPYKHQFWAPEIHKLGKRFYLIFGGSNWIDDKDNINGRMGYYQFVGVADSVGGPYSHFTALKGPGVDTSLFEDDDGKTYAVWPGNEIHPIDLSQINQGKITVGPMVSRAAGPDDYKALNLPVPGTLEGPYLIKYAGTYYCFFATTYPDLYATGIATAQSLAGPWTLDPRVRAFPGGHQAEFIGPNGGWWTAYKHEHSDTAPWLSVDPLTFDADGKVQTTLTTGPQSLPLAGKQAP